MKNIRYRIYSLLLGAMLLSHSCIDPLEIAPISSIGANSFWQTEQDALGGIFGMYNQFRVLSTRTLYYMGEARSEVMGHGLQNADFRQRYFENDMDENTADLDWLQSYRVINYANLVIKNVPNITFPNEANKNNILAQGYTMRAFMYFVLAKTWGDVPLMIEPVEGFDAESTFKERAPVSSIFELIKADLDMAISLYPNDQFPNGRAMFSKAAANMLKGDVYLWTGKRMDGGNPDLNTALSALNEARNANLSLLPNFSDIFSFNNKGNNEVLFAVHFNDFESPNNYFSDMYINANDFRDSFGPETLARIGNPGGFNWWAPTSLIMDQFHQEDQRRDGSFFEIYATEDNQRTFIGSIVTKARGYTEAGTRRFLDDIVIYRYGELLLLIAEAKNALGQDPSEEINMIRERAFQENFDQFQFENGSQEENDEVILQERLFELAFEGKRWWDLVRFDKAFEKVPSLQSRAGNDHLLLWPITLETISLNSRITQNPGY